MKTADSPTPFWSFPQKLAFRFLFLFFGLFIAFVNNGAFPGWEFVTLMMEEVWHRFIPWVGKHVLHLSYDITVFTNGSGDTTYDYVLLLVLVVAALFGTLVWTLADRKSKSYPGLYYWLTVAVRYYVGLMLFSYGLVKVIKLQFPAPGLFRLTQLYGDSSPMGLAWTFLGFSEGYNLFMGLAEMAAVLLLFRRTATFGAVLTFMTAANVMAVNYFYDVPVKIVSTALVLMSLFLLSNDAARLWGFFFSGEPVALPAMQEAALPKRWMRVAKRVVKGLLLFFLLVFAPYQTWQNSKIYGSNAPKPKHYGLYTVETFTVGNDTLPPLITDTIRWNQVIIEREGMARVRYMGDSSAVFIAKTDTLQQTWHWTLRNDSTVQYTLRYEMPDTSRINLRGRINGDTVVMALLRKDLKDFRLMNRGFHWISEYPYNR